ncbi:hypothetical protein WDU94_013222 [Cyamophila willieti]
MPEDDKEDDIFSFSSDKKTVPINSPAPNPKKITGGGAPSNNPFNGIQELSNQWKDGNFNNLKKIADTNANNMMNVFSLGSNWMGTNMRLLSQWNDLNREIGNKLITTVHQTNGNNLRFIKSIVETNNNNTKATVEPMFKKISDLRDTFNANPDEKDDAKTNSLALVSKTGRPVETLAEITNELPSGLVNSASSWLGKK